MTNDELDAAALWTGRISAWVLMIAGALLCVFQQWTLGLSLLSFLFGLGSGYSVGRKNSAARTSPPLDAR